MGELTIYHNPKCSKSRQTLALIVSKNITPKVILYLEKNISKSEIKNLVLKLSLPIRDILRKSEDEYVKCNLDNQKLNDDEIINSIIRFPKLMERPIVVKGDKAIIGRPPENVLKLI